MKKAILLLATMLSLFMNVARTQPQRPVQPSPEAIQAMQDDVYKNAPLVFEGKELKHEYHGGNWSNMVTLVQVVKSYRGDLKAGDIVELWYADGRKFKEGKPVPLMLDEEAATIQYETGDAGIDYFMCNYTDTHHVFTTDQHSGKKCVGYYLTKISIFVFLNFKFLYFFR